MMLRYGEKQQRVQQKLWKASSQMVLRKTLPHRIFVSQLQMEKLYATVLKCSTDHTYCIKSLGIQDASKKANFSGIIRKVEVLGKDGELAWTRDEEGLHIECGVESDKPIVFRITID